MALYSYGPEAYIVLAFVVMACGFGSDDAVPPTKHLRQSGCTCLGACVYTCAAMCAHLCMDLRIEMCVDLCADTCVGIRANTYCRHL